MARKFWTLLPEAYYTHKQVARGGRNEVAFAVAGRYVSIQDVCSTTLAM